MTKLTELATGRITAVDTLTIELGEPYVGRADPGR